MTPLKIAVLNGRGHPLLGAGGTAQRALVPSRVRPRPSGNNTAFIFERKRQGKMMHIFALINYNQRDTREIRCHLYNENRLCQSRSTVRSSARLTPGTRKFKRKVIRVVKDFPERVSSVLRARRSASTVVFFVK
jgi:hypothetical protein